MTSETRQRAIYVISDYVTTTIAYVLFNIVRYYLFAFGTFGSLDIFIFSSPVVKGIIFIPIMMLGIYYLSGYYYTVNFRSRADELFNTLLTTFIGSILIYFMVILNDEIDDRGAIYELVGILWGLMFGCVYLARILITLTVVKRLHTRKVGYNTLVVGTSQAAVNMVSRLNNMRKSMGFNIIGYVTDDDELPCDDLGLPVYNIADLSRLCDELNVINIIVLPHRNGAHATISLINRLFPVGRSIYVSPFLFQLISGKRSFGNVAGEPLIDISKPDISPVTASCKRASDIVLSLFALVALSPFLAIIGAAVFIDSPGKIFYLQERIGYHKRKFRIIKFRTMRADAEDNGPALSAPDDPRVTRVGRFLRKYRLDELLQFWNVVKGEMSIVGPRPEREYYVRQIIERVPYYSLVHGVRPGITSWGMVKYGYAMNVDEMVERLKYDLIYIENMSLGIDFKIILYTIKTVVTGRGI